MTAFADLTHPTADFDQQVAVLRLAGSQHFQIRTADVFDVIAKRRNRLVLDGYGDQPVYRRVSNRTTADLFDRVFAGAGSTGDLGSLVRDFNCEVIVLIPQDGAWSCARLLFESCVSG